MSTIEAPILIASSSIDEHAYGPVRHELESRGFPVVVYRTDRVLDGQENIHVNIGSGGSLTVEYGGVNITPDVIGAAWFRKVGSFALPNNAGDKARELYVRSEIGYMNEALWGSYPEEKWLNAPSKIRLADQKIGQLITARELGFSIPETVITGSWGDVETDLLNGDVGQIVAKTIRGVISRGGNMEAMYSTPLGINDIAMLRPNTTPFPGIYQPLIAKKKEWRTTVVGEQVFSAAIYTDDTAKDDWRILQQSDAVRFEQEDLPDTESQKCLEYLAKMGLKFGAFDFIQTPDDEIIFLECNPNGQYGWLEKQLGFPISRAISDELVAISEQK